MYIMDRGGSCCVCHNYIFATIEVIHMNRGIHLRSRNLFEALDPICLE